VDRGRSLLDGNRICNFHRFDLTRLSGEPPPWLEKLRQDALQKRTIRRLEQALPLAGNREKGDFSSEPCHKNLSLIDLNGQRAFGRSHEPSGTRPEYVANLLVPGPVVSHRPYAENVRRQLLRIELHIIPGAFPHITGVREQIMHGKWKVW